MRGDGRDEAMPARVHAGHEGETLRSEVPALMDGLRVDRAVAMLANVSRSAATELVETGRVVLDGVLVRSGKRVLREGQALAVTLPAEAPARVRAEPAVAFDVLHADPALAIVDKPAGLVVHPGAGHAEGTLVGGLLARFPELSDLVRAGVCAADRPGIVHRLDKGTSGLLVVARTEAAYRSLVDQLATRAMRRRYVALVAGDVEGDKGEVEAPIGRSARTPTKMAVTATGKPARTMYSVTERFEGRATLLDVSLHSGRTHQIRVHMAAIGHPVIGDARYGAADARLGSGRFFLHAGTLALEHPVSGEPMLFESPLPTDLAAFLEAIRHSPQV
jgi:23S rRNA pseudouridine1911/1915/1917 synthase